MIDELIRLGTICSLVVIQLLGICFASNSTIFKKDSYIQAILISFTNGLLVGHTFLNLIAPAKRYFIIYDQFQVLEMITKPIWNFLSQFLCVISFSLFLFFEYYFTYSFFNKLTSGPNNHFYYEKMEDVVIELDELSEKNKKKAETLTNDSKAISKTFNKNPLEYSKNDYQNYINFQIDLLQQSSYGIGLIKLILLNLHECCAYIIITLVPRGGLVKNIFVFSLFQLGKGFILGGKLTKRIKNENKFGLQSQFCLLIILGGFIGFILRLIPDIMKAVCLSICSGCLLYLSLTKNVLRPGYFAKKKYSKFLFYAFGLGFISYLK